MADRPDVRRRRDQLFLRQALSSRGGVGRQLRETAGLLSGIPDHRLRGVRACLHAGTKTPGEQGRRVAAVPYLDSAFHLPPGLLHCAVQDHEARYRRQAVRLGQARPHRNHVPRDREAHRSLLSTDRKSTRLNSSHLGISYAVFCLKKKQLTTTHLRDLDALLSPTTPRITSNNF